MGPLGQYVHKIIKDLDETLPALFQFRPLNMMNSLKYCPSSHNRGQAAEP